MSALRSFATLVVVCITASLAAAAPSSSRARVAPPVRAAADRAGALRFEPNVGQTDARVAYVARTRDGACFLTGRDAVLRARDGATVRIGLAGASDAAKPTASGPLPGTTSYLRGAPERWRTNVPGYATVRYADVIPGVDLVYYGERGRLEYDLALAPGADARHLRLRVDGAERIEVDPSGDLLLSTSGSAIRQRAPRAYQIEPGGRRRPVSARYVVASAREVGFALGAVDARLPLVVDPEIAFSTYLGGSDLDDGSDVAVDASGAVYVSGSTSSTDFPSGPVRTTNDSDAFVTKLDASGGSIVYTAYVGGDDFDSGDALAVDASGSAVVAGLTLSKNFPVISAAQRDPGGNADGFVAKLAPDGRSLVWSTYLGGALDDQVTDLLTRADGTVVAGGRTTSENFPTAGSVASHFGGTADGFVTVLSAAGGALVSSVYLGGNGTEQVDSLVDGGDGTVYATGVTDSRDFAICSEATAHPFVARVAPDETTAKAFACDADGLASCFAAGGPENGELRIHALVSGGTATLDVRSITLDADLATIGQTTFGGSGQDYPDAIAVGPDGTVYVAGDTDSTDLPTVDPVQSTLGGDLDGFVAALDPGTGVVRFATYLGGSGLEFPAALAVDASGNVFVAGLTYSDDFPVANAVQGAFAGGSDAFVAKLGAPGPAGPGFALSVDPASAEVARGKRYAVRVNVLRSGGFDGSVTVSVADTKPLRVKVTPASASTTGGFVNFLLKLKKKAPLGPHPIVFTGTDASGVTRTATFTLTVK